MRAEPSVAMLFAELDNKRYAPGYLEKPLSPYQKLPRAHHEGPRRGRRGWPHPASSKPLTFIHEP